MTWRKRILAACLAVLMPVIGFAADTGMPIMPIVPASVVPGAAAVPAPVVPNAPDSVITSDMLQPLKLTMKNGVEQLVALAVNHTNRIVTPFVNPKLHTASNLTVDPKGSVLYITSSTETTVSVYITEGDNESMALALTFVFKKVPPRELTLLLPDDVTPPVPRMNPIANGDGGGNSQMPYVQDIRESMKAVALGRVPDGYSMRNIKKNDLVPYCGLPPGLNSDWHKAEVMEGGDLQIVVGVMKNDTQGPLEPVESWCATDEVMAVSFWPRNYLEPGQETEVIILRHRPHPELRGTVRPSLVRN